MAGSVVLGAGLVVGTPTGLGQAFGSVTVRDVALTAGDSDLLTPWIDQYNAASQNATQLLNAFFDAPNVGLQQLIANQFGYLQAFLNDPTSSSVTAIGQEMQANLAAVLTGFTLQNAWGSLAGNEGTIATVIAHTLDSGHSFLLQEVPQFLPTSVNAAEVTQILDFLSSPLSGIIMGALGPEIAPWVALYNSITDGDDGNTTLANMVGAYFNGADLSLNSLIPSIEQAGFLPAGYNIENLGIAFGGLLSPGEVGGYAPYPVGIGGSIFNSVSIHLAGAPAPIDYLGQAVGPLGAWEGWAQAIASLLGWDGTGSPLSDVTLPVIPTDVLDDGGVGAAAADAPSLWQELVALF
ncbi:outer membrane porin GjpA [Mycolicibacter icosiumassiliensis]|uniref:outer membrane porin GjpA n=1 Tax=Mycolicibacter icosiumassiliensis TaxID=1792835 RepID=UPI000BDF7C79|nr:outer membrane porin GjpA [Mycolicibacter icosiumassiliensis]